MHQSPTTGRVVAVVLMLGGIALLGVVTATLASWLVERVSEANEAEQAATRAQVASLSAQVASLEQLLRNALEAPSTLGDSAESPESEKAVPAVER